MGKYIRGNVDEQISLGTLAATTAVSTGFDDVVNERTLVSSLVATYSLENMTYGAGIGPLLVGICHGDYNDTEIEEYIEATASWNEGDMIAQEVAKRKIRRIGQFTVPANVGQVSLQDGKPIKTKLNWILTQGQTLRLWVYNTGTNALATTVPVCRVQGHANLWPR